MKILILDFETMGSDALECAAVDMSIIQGDTEKMLSDKPYTCADIKLAKKFKLSVKDQVEKYKFTVQPGALDFWSNVSPEARSCIKPLATDLTVSEFINQLIQHLNTLGDLGHWFTRGNTFDPIILQRLFKVVNKTELYNEYLKFYKVQDTRTHINAKLDYPKSTNFCPIKDETYWKNTFIEHDSSWDVLADLLRYQTILRLENDLAQPER